MTAQIAKRDYSLVGPDTKRAEEMGLATAEWYASLVFIYHNPAIAFLSVPRFI